MKFKEPIEVINKGPHVCVNEFFVTLQCGENQITVVGPDAIKLADILLVYIKTLAR